MKISTFAFASLLLVAACEQKSAPSGQTPVPPPVAVTPTPAAAAPPAAAAGEPPLIANGTKMKCPVSGEDFTVSDKTKQVAFNGKRVALCCPDCLPKFEANPAKYVQ
jgi:hypothetical protein